MNVLKVVLPVFVMIAAGVLCRRTQFLSQKGIDDLKKLLTTVILPVAIFEGMATGDYSGKTGLVVAAMFGVVVVTFVLGFVLNRLVKEPYRKYFPFLMSVYEGGMIAYPLFINLCGSDALSKIAVLDIAGCAFCFSVYINVLVQMESGEKATVKDTLLSAFRNPVFIATLLGVLCGATGVIKRLIASPAGPVYLGIEGMFTSALSAMILIVVGYSFSLEKRLIGPCLAAIFSRFALQALSAIPMVLLVKSLFPGDRVMLAAILLYLAAPPSFSMPTFVKSEEGAKYLATANSLYVIVTIIVYSCLAAFVV